MKKSLIALAAVAVTGAAFAQSSVTLSGSISVGVMDTGLAGAKAGVANLGGGTNAINMVSVEDLGGGLKGGFNGQIRFNAATGDRNSSGTGAALFHAANAYVSGGFGTVAIGKIAEASNCAFDPWGCTGGAGLMAGAPGTKSALIAAGTQAQSVSYTTPKLGGFTGSIQSSVSTRTNERRVFNLTYAGGPLSAQFLRSENLANTAGDTGVIPADAEGSGQFIGVSYDLGVAKLGVFNSATKNAAKVTTVNITGLTASIPLGAATILAGFSKDKEAVSSADTKIALGVNYPLSKRTTLGADVFKQDAAGGGTGWVTRIRHTF